MNSLSNMNIKNYSTILQKKNLFILLIIFFTFFLDRISKIKILELQNDYKTIFVNDFLNFDLIWNSGIGFGLLSSDSTLFYNLITLIISGVIFLIYLIIKSSFSDKVFFSLISVR